MRATYGPPAWSEKSAREAFLYRGDPTSHTHAADVRCRSFSDLCALRNARSSRSIVGVERRRHANSRRSLSKRMRLMSNYDGNSGVPGVSANVATAIDAGLRAFMLRVYNYMAAGVGLTGIAAFLTYQFTGPELLQSPLMWVFILAPLGLVFFISARINTLSVEAARGLFFLYAALVGISLSTIFHIYTQSSITRVFFISAAAFGALSIWGYTTQRNLSGFGTFLFMGLIGIIIASLVNLFLR